MKKIRQSGGRKAEKATGAQPPKSSFMEAELVRRCSCGGDVHCSGDRNTGPSF